MQELFIEHAHRTPSIRFSPDENVFYLRGESSPEDARKLYYPVVEWVRNFVDEIQNGSFKTFSNENPLKLQIDLSYFNSSSAKFLYDLLIEFKKLPQIGVHIVIEWYYDSWCAYRY